MTKSYLNLVDSELIVKASGNIDIEKDLQLPEGKSIAQLLYDQKKSEEKTTEK